MRSGLTGGLIAALSLHGGALTAMLHHREVVTNGAAGRSAQEGVMTGIVAADTADGRTG